MDDWYEISGQERPKDPAEEEARLERAARKEAKTQELARQAALAEPKFIECTIHKFKSNIAYYMREAEAGCIKGVILKRYGQQVGFYCPYTPNG